MMDVLVGYLPVKTRVDVVVTSIGFRHHDSYL